MHEPFTPRIPRWFRERPLILGVLLSGVGVSLSVLIVTTMHRWPLWLLFPSMFLAVIAMAATSLGLCLIVVVGLQPLISMKDDLEWDDEPLASMGIPRSLQRKCEQHGYWTCEALSKAIDKSIFPWTEFEYDERQQITRAVGFWKAVAGRSES